MEGASISHGVHPEGLRGILREHFATKWETVFGAEVVEDWLKHLGLAVAKQDIHDEAKKIAEYMVEVKGYNTGEDFATGEEADIEEARTNGTIALGDVSVRTIWRYMTNKVPTAGNVHQTAAGSPGKSNTTASSQQATEATEALVKIANSTAEKVPELKGKMPRPG